MLSAVHKKKLKQTCIITYRYLIYILYIELAEERVKLYIAASIDRIYPTHI
jgi:hypothetical protein